MTRSHEASTLEHREEKERLVGHLPSHSGRFPRKSFASRDQHSEIELHPPKSERLVDPRHQHCSKPDQCFRRWYVVSCLCPPIRRALVCSRLSPAPKLQERHTSKSLKRQGLWSRHLRILPFADGRPCDCGGHLQLG